MILARGRARPDLDERFRRSRLHRYLLADETVIVAQRQHWASVAVPVGAAVAGLLVVITLNFLLAPSILTDLLWWALLALTVWAASKWFMWRRNWLIATNKRVMVNYGLFHQGVAMFSLIRVPDLTYIRSTLGHLLGYGTLKRESSGINQTLHEVRFVEHPHATYTTICAAIFDLQDRMFGMDEDENDHRLEDGRPPPHAPGLVTTTAGSAGPIKARDEPVQGDDPPGIRIHYGVSRHHNRDPWHLSADLSESSPRDDSLREADTGPIPYRRSSTDEGGDWRTTSNDPNEDHRKNQDQDQDKGQDKDLDRDR